MKGQWLSLVLWTTFLLLLGHGNSHPSAEATWNLLTRQGGGSSKPAGEIELPGDPPSYVFRGDMRLPEEIERAGGFLPRTRAEALSAEEIEKSSSLYYHTYGATPEYTKYVSTTTNPKVAYQFSAETYVKPAKFGRIYRISADNKMVDAVKSLGNNIKAGYADQAEQAVVGGVPHEQIEGWYESKDIGPKEIERLQKGEKLENLFKPNPKFNAEKYAQLRGSGVQPQLAGLRENAEGWNKEPWSKFKGQKVSKNLEDFISKSICKRDTGCLPVGKGAVEGAEAVEAEEGFTEADILGARDLTGALEAGEIAEGRLSVQILEAGQALQGAEALEATEALEAAEAAEAVEAVEAVEALGVVEAVEGATLLEEIMGVLGFLL